MSTDDPGRARRVIALTDASAMHTVIEAMSCIEDVEALRREYEEMRAELRADGMESDHAVEVINLFAEMVHVYRQTVQ